VNNRYEQIRKNRKDKEKKEQERKKGEKKKKIELQGM
jgi:hypothetical protein